MTYLRELRKGFELTYCVRSLRLYSLDKPALPNHWKYVVLTRMCALCYSRSALHSVSEG